MDELVAGCLKNDRKAQRDLYNLFAPSMLGVCSRYTRTKEEAEDIMIEGFLRVFQKIGSYRHECSLSSWIQSIMVNVSIDHYRVNLKHLKDETIEEETLLVQGVHDSDEQILTKLEAKQVLGILAQMPEEYRIIFNLRVMEEHSFKEIAQELDRNENTVRVYFQRGRTWLQTRIQEEEGKIK